LKLIADVGLTGLPNAGKSTLLSVVSDARPRIAPFPFSTLSPNLGVVVHRNERFVMVDIPGIIEGASRGAGLGFDFLRHVERVRLLLCLVDLAPLSGSSPWEDFSILRGEFSQYSEALSRKPFFVVGTKLDIPGARENWEKFRQVIAQNRLEGVAISAVTGEGVADLLDRVVAKLRELKDEPEIPKSAVTVTDKGIRQPLYRFHSQYLLRLMKEIDFNGTRGEEVLNQKLQESGFVRYFRAMKPGSEVDIGGWILVWDGKELRLKDNHESERMDRKK